MFHWGEPSLERLISIAQRHIQDYFVLLPRNPSLGRHVSGYAGARIMDFCIGSWGAVANLAGVVDTARFGSG